MQSLQKERAETDLMMKNNIKQTQLSAVCKKGMGWVMTIAITITEAIIKSGHFYHSISDKQLFSRLVRGTGEVCRT